MISKFNCSILIAWSILLALMAFLSACGSIGPLFDQSGTPTSEPVELGVLRLNLMGLKRGAYVSDLHYNPLAQVDSSKTQSLITDLPDVPLMIVAYVEVPGFGNLNFTTANGGNGYRPSGQTLDVVYEIAQHRLMVSVAILNYAIGEGYQFDDGIQEKLAEAENNLAQAKTFASGSEAQYEAAIRSLQYSGPASEAIVVEWGKQKLDRQGGLRSGVLVSTFGLFEAQEEQAWREVVDPVFNGVVQAYHWQLVMQPDVKYNWKFTIYDLGDTINRMTEMDKEIRGHTILWLSSWMPLWFTDPTLESIKALMIEYTDALMAQYPQIRFWNIGNELNNSWSNLGWLEPEQVVELIGAVSSEVNLKRPDVMRGINSVMLWGEDAAVHLGEKPRVVAPYGFYQMLAEAGVEYDYIGMQIYFHGWDLFEFHQLLEKYHQLGKRIHITESAAPSSNKPDPINKHFPSGHPGQTHFQWHGPWSEESQADWLEGMFVVSLCKDYVDEWTWWDVGDYFNSYYPYGGLVTRQYEPKLSYLRLQTLIDRWGHNMEGFGNH